MNQDTLPPARPRQVHQRIPRRAVRQREGCRVGEGEAVGDGVDEGMVRAVERAVRAGHAYRDAGPARVERGGHVPAGAQDGAGGVEA